MKISGFTIIKNAVLNDYPIVEAIRSVLPVVDEMIVLAGDSEDATKDLLLAIGDAKIRIVDSVWDKTIRSGGTVLAVETNKAFDLIGPGSDWAFYIQGDEVVPEQYHQVIREGCLRYKDHPEVQGLLFKYLHFYGTYDYVGDSRTWYAHEVRIIRNDKNIRAYKDAQGFRIGQQKLRVKALDAYIYHYGWVKSPEQMLKKNNNMGAFWETSAAAREAMQESFDYTQFDSLERFTGSHPAVMQERIGRQNWHLELDISRKKFSLKDRFLYYFEKLTGIRPFDFRNYKVLR